jgi:membrane-bound serine protease (ClpP class)
MAHVSRLGWVLCLVGATVCLLARPAAAQSGTPTVLQLDLSGVVDPFVADYLDRGIQQATEDGDAAVLILIDTPGGLDSSMRQITQAISKASVPVIGYVAPQGARAASAGAFVLMSCPVAAMAPGTNVGAATPVGLSGATGSEKAVNDAAAYMRSLAEARGRSADVAASFVTEATSLSADQALQQDVIDLIAPTTSELLSDVDGMSITLGNGSSVTLHTAGAQVVDQGMGGFFGFLHRLLDPNVAFVFFWLGLALIVLEIIVPGHIFSGTLGTILLILAVVSFGLLPVRLVGIALLVGAAIAFAVEAAHPGLGIWGVLGLVALVLGGWFLYDRSGGAGVSPATIVPVAIFIGVFFGLVVTKARQLREMPPPVGPEAIVGREGVALRGGLDPTGVVRVDAEEWRAISGGRRIPGGARVRVTGIDGLVLTVEPVPHEDVTAAVAPPATGEGETP